MDRDFWIEREDVLVRIHVTPRRTFFDPRTWKTKDEVLKNQLLHELGDSRETTCVPCSRGVPVLNIQHTWRDEHGPRADSLWIGRSLFRRQVRQQFDPSSSPPPDEHCAYFTMEDEQGPVDPGPGGTTGGDPQGMDSSRTASNAVGGTRATRPDEAQAVRDFAPSSGPVEEKPTRGVLMKMLRGNAPPSAEEMVPFGKYKGYKYGEVPEGYLVWAEEEVKANVNHSQDLARLARWSQHQRKATPGVGSSRGDPEENAVVQPPHLKSTPKKAPRSQRTRPLDKEEAATSTGWSEVEESMEEQIKDLEARLGVMKAIHEQEKKIEASKKEANTPQKGALGYPASPDQN